MTFSITAKAGRKIQMMMLGLSLEETLKAVAALEKKMETAEEFSIAIEKETGS